MKRKSDRAVSKRHFNSLKHLTALVVEAMCVLAPWNSAFSSLPDPRFPYPPIDKPVVIAGTVVSIEPTQVAGLYGDSTMKALVTVSVHRTYLGTPSEEIAFVSSNLLYTRPGSGVMEFVDQPGSAWYAVGDKILSVIGKVPTRGDSLASMGSGRLPRFSAVWTRFLRPQAEFADEDSLYYKAPPTLIYKAPPTLIPSARMSAETTSKLRALNNLWEGKLTPQPSSSLASAVSSIQEFYRRIGRKEGARP